MRLLKSSLIICALLFSAQNVLALHAPQSQTAVASQPKKVLFVVSAGHALIKKVGSNYALHVNLNNIRQILVYTTRPHRLVKYVRRSSLKQAWYGKIVSHNFANRAPNAVLATQNAHPAIVIIASMHMFGSHVDFIFRPMKPGMFSIPVGQVRKLVLTIDSQTTGQIAGEAVGGAVGGAAVVGGVAAAVKYFQLKAADKASLQESLQVEDTSGLDVPGSSTSETASTASEGGKVTQASGTVGDTVGDADIYMFGTTVPPEMIASKTMYLDYLSRVKGSDLTPAEEAAAGAAYDKATAPAEGSTSAGDSIGEAMSDAAGDAAAVSAKGAGEAAGTVAEGADVVADAL